MSRTCFGTLSLTIFDERVEIRPTSSVDSCACLFFAQFEDDNVESVARPGRSRDRRRLPCPGSHPTRQSQSRAVVRAAQGDHRPGRTDFDRFFAGVMPAHPLRLTDSHAGGTMKLSHAVPLIAAMISGMSIAADPTKKTWDFEKDESGRIAKGFTNEVGQVGGRQGRRQPCPLPESQERRRHVQCCLG